MQFLETPQRPLWWNNAQMQQRRFETTKGTVMLQTHCSPSFIAQLTADDGLRAFAHLPEREHQLLLDIASNSQSMLTLAYDEHGTIVGQITLASSDPWWRSVANVCEVGIEVSYHWRRLGIAHQLLALALNQERLEEMILLAIGLVWHWDTERTGLSPAHYRLLIRRLLASYGFDEYITNEPNVAMSAVNILLARVGSNIEIDTMYQFFACLLDGNKHR